MAQPEAWGDVVLGAQGNADELSSFGGGRRRAAGRDLRGARPGSLSGNRVHRVLQALLGLPAPHYHHHRLVLDADGHKLASRRTRPRCASCAREGATPADIRRASPGLNRLDCCSFARGEGMRKAKRAKAAKARQGEAPAPRNRVRAPARPRPRSQPRPRDPHAAQRHSGAGRADRCRRSARARTRMGGPGEKRGRASGASRDPGGRRRARAKDAGWCLRARAVSPACACRGGRRDARGACRGEGARGRR